MFLRKTKPMLFLLLGCLLAVLSGAYTMLTASIASAASTSVSTNCPAPGTGRAAVLPALALGLHQTLVYESTQYTTGGTVVTSTLKRYDATTRQTTTLFTQNGRDIVMPQVSANRQWVVFESVHYNGANTDSRVQLIRVDGQYLQTLYCTPKSDGLNGIQWSTDQKFIAFALSTGRVASIHLLNTHTGSVQTELTLPDFTYVNLKTWLDTQRIYLTNVQIDSPSNIIYLLDTRKGANQHLRDLTTVFHGSFNDFDSSYNGKDVYINTCTCGQGGDTGPGTISVGPATGGHMKTVYSTTKYAITQVRAVTPRTLLFTIHNELAVGTTDTSHNGLWRINSDGTGLTRLATGNTYFAAWSQFPWSNVARDNSLYGVQASDNNGLSILVGSLNGGTPTTAALVLDSHTSLMSVGWAVM